MSLLSSPQTLFSLTFLPMCSRDKASCAQTVLFPTPPFPDSTTTMWSTSESRGRFSIARQARDHANSVRTWTHEQRNAPDNDMASRISNYLSMPKNATYGRPTYPWQPTTLTMAAGDETVAANCKEISYSQLVEVSVIHRIDRSWLHSATVDREYIGYSLSLSSLVC